LVQLRGYLQRTAHGKVAANVQERIWVKIYMLTFATATLVGREGGKQKPLTDVLGFEENAKGLKERMVRTFA
jgi:hypothetical protein